MNKPLSAILISVLAIGAGLAQHNNRSARDFQFRFANPGARSLAFGGAFIGLADDATAPVANPAGMTRTQRRSASLELNYERMDNDIPFQGGTILQTNLFEFDYQFTTSDAPENTFQAPYLAAVFPKGNWRFGVFGHQQANIKRQYTTDPIVICHLESDFYPNCNPSNADLSFNPSTDTLDVDMLNTGLSLAYGFGSRFSLGASLFWSSLDYQSDSIISFRTVLDTVPVNKLARGDDNDWGAILGILWQVTDEVSLGLTYKRQPEFEVTAELTTGRPLPNVPSNFQTQGPFNIPDSLGIGVSLTPLDQLTLNIDANRVYYSEITDDLIDFAQIDNGDRTSAITQTMADITEIHVGLEWIFANLARPLSMRLGYWLEPYHAAVNNIDDSQLLEGSPQNPVVRDIFFLHLFEEDINHYSFGFGLTLNRNFQLDGAVEWADSGRNATVSGIYRF